MAAIAAMLLSLSGGGAIAQTIEQISVHSPAIEGNLEGNSADREVFVLLPPGYDSAPERRYPVVYFLHGFTAHAATYVERGEALEAAKAVMAEGPELILVFPDSYTRHGGSMYSTSPTTGDFEGFVTRDLIAYVDSHYRTIATRESRGLAGHSMGGYGTLKLGMKYPDLFSSLYAMSPCCTAPTPITGEQAAQLAQVTPEQADNAPFFLRAALASFAAWSPAPDKPPFFFDTGAQEDGTVDPIVVGRLAANAPEVMLPQYLPALARMEAIGMEVGDSDFLIDGIVAMHEAMTRFGLAHDWEVYQGDHMNRLPVRFREKLLPFFQQHLDQQ
ncbi:alpha/beta hydrolase [Stakelama tenebrarum]|uniref:alpha/beta hydrolase n=1 Tax=Stakelama tenebrarum TaxID=2711215 RepID=UPI001D17FF46|nr:alpha/beta hydrolase-fold protein [Sphingosinithalassobacter tenebrarum]